MISAHATTSLLRGIDRISVTYRCWVQLAQGRACLRLSASLAHALAPSHETTRRANRIRNNQFHEICRVSRPPGPGRHENCKLPPPSTSTVPPAPAPRPRPHMNIGFSSGSAAFLCRCRRAIWDPGKSQRSRKLPVLSWPRAHTRPHLIPTAHSQGR